MSTPDTAAQPSWQLRRNGFDVILGNPPWERVKLQEQEFFAQRDPAVAGAPNAAARKKAIAALKDTNPALLAEFHEATRQAEGESHLLRSSGRYPLCGRGDINTYAVFAESMRDAIGPTGRLGVIVPTGIATDDTTKWFLADLVRTRTLASLMSFENEEFIFPAVHHAMKFCLLTLCGYGDPQPRAEFVFLARSLSELRDAARGFSLSANEVRLMSPNTLTLKVFRYRRDAEIVSSIHQRLPVLDDQAKGVEGNVWSLTIRRLFDVNKSEVLALCNRTPQDGSARPLYEGKMIHQFDHRFGTYAGQTTAQANQGKLPEVTRDQHADPALTVEPFYWLRSEDAEASLSRFSTCPWLLAWRDITSSNLERTVTATILPRVPTDFTVRVGFLGGDRAACDAAALLALFNSFVFDYNARVAIGGNHLSDFILRQLPVLTPQHITNPAPWTRAISLSEWIIVRVLELVYTAHDLAGFARDLGYDGLPFRWDPARRAQIRAELDAGFFHLYGISRDDAAYIMDTFLVFKARDEERNGGIYKTKETILAIYDEMAAAIAGGNPWVTTLDPPPGPPADADGKYTPMAEWDDSDWPPHIHRRPSERGQDV